MLAVGDGGAGGTGTIASGDDGSPGSGHQGGMGGNASGSDGGGASESFGNPGGGGAGGGGSGHVDASATRVSVAAGVHDGDGIVTISYRGGRSCPTMSASAP